MKKYKYFLGKILFVLVLMFSLMSNAIGQTTYYTYKTGPWNDLDTWTTDPGGTTLVGSAIPTDGDAVVVLMSRTVTLTNDTATTTLDITINTGGILDIASNSFTSGLTALRGEGKLRLSSTNFPTATTNTFVQTSGGTTEYYNSSNFTLPVAQTEYNNLTLDLNTTAIIASQLSNITLYGSLYVKVGIYQINDASANRRQLTINGNVTVDAGSSIKVGTGVTNSTTDPIGISGGTAPFIDYYDAQSHRVVIYGDFTNDGTVSFTNLAYPIYDAFPPTTVGATTGFATVYFMGASDNTLTCNNTTDFYNLVVDKGTDQTYQLSVNSSDYPNFRLFGANTSGGENGGNNPDLKKALWIRTGTFRLFGKVVIPSLSEGTCDGGLSGGPNSDFYVPTNAALVIDGPDVILLTTADDYTEVNAAYGTVGPSNAAMGVNSSASCSSFSILGKFQVDDGYVSARESGGFIYWASSSGEFIINGGTIDAKQFRTANASGGLTAYRQTGGTFNLRGRIRNDISGVSVVADLATVPLSNTQSTGGIQSAVGTFNIDRDDNIFEMSGGIIKIYDVCGETGTAKAYEVNSLPAYYNVSGGTVEIIPTDGSRTGYNYYVASSAPIYNLTLDDSDGSGFDVILTDIPAKTGVTARTNPPLTVSNDLTFTNNATLLSNNYEVQIGGDFNLSAGSTYTPGTNWTTFNGSGYQTFTGDGTITSGFYKLNVDKSADTLILAGVPASYTVRDSLEINEGLIDDGGKTINVAGHIYNAGTHTGTGKIVLNGAAAQTLEESVFGSPSLGNVELNNANDASLLSDFTMNGFTFNTGILDISQYRLTVGSGGVTAYSSVLYFYTNGLISDGGLRMYVDASTLTTGNDLVYPIGINAANGYTPATIVGNSAPGTGTGYVTFIPIDNEHPARKVSGKYLLYYWKSIAEGMPATSNVYYDFYNNIASDWDNGINRAYSLLDGGTTWNSGGTGSEPDVSLSGVPNSAGFISAEISAGNNGAFNNIDAYYTIASGDFNSTDVWSTTSHTGADCNCSPSANTDIIYIGGDAATNRNDSIGVTAGFTAALITINGSYTNDKDKPVLNIQSLGGSITVNNIKGNGKFTTTSATLTSANMGDFLNGDSAVFNYHDVATDINNSITSYPNLLITSTGANVTTLINSSILVQEDLTISSNTTGNILRFNNSGGDLIIYGDLKLDNVSSLEFDGTTVQNLSIYGNLDLDYDDSGSEANTLGVNAGNANHQINFYGDSIIVGASSINVPDGKLSILDSLNTVITDGAGSITLNDLTVNKNSLTDSVTISEDFTLNGTTNSSPKALTLSKGTLILENAATDVDLSSGGADFEIPQTAALHLKNGASVNVTGDGTGIFLDGLLSAEGTSAIDLGDGSTTNNRYIEYSGSGNAEIILSGSASLTVNSQIRRSLSQTNGVIKFDQSGSASTTIYGRGGSATRAKFEVVNTGSEFYMTGGNFTIIRGGGGDSFGDLYLRPATGFATGGTLTLGSVDIGSTQTIKFRSNIDLNTLVLDGVNFDNTFELLVDTLTMNGALTINTSNSIFNANGIDVILKGDFTNNGTYSPGSNTTTFNGVTQTLLGSTVTDFYNLVSEPSTSLTFNYDVTIANDLSINLGTLSTSTYDVFVSGDIINNGIHSGDAGSGGLILNGSVEQQISGTGTFGRLNLYNPNGARLLNNVSLEQDLYLSNGVLNINQYLLTLGTSADIVDTTGAGFSSSKMIEPDGVFSNVGIKKNFTAGAKTLNFPLGISGKYTPADIDITANTGAGFLRINCINDNHPTVIDDTEVLQYYWEIESSGISGFDGELKLKYNDGDVTGTESDYVAARLVIPDGTTWSKATPGSDATDNVLEATDSILFNFNGVDNVSGEYTAGGDVAIPSTVPTYTSNQDGDWDDVNIWTPAAPAGGPNGFIVVISAGDSVNTNGNRRFAYKTTINGVLDVGSTYGQNFGTVDGTGRLRLEGPILPAGRFTSFLSCSGGIMEYSGSTDYTIIADRLDTIRGIYFTGTGKRILPAKDLVICDTLKISGATLDNSVNERNLTINGAFQRLNSGVFTSGGNGATVIFAGSSAQTLGGADGEFTGSNGFNNFVINNSSGLTLNSPLEINGTLTLTDGVITTTSTNILKMLNGDGDADGIVLPAAGGSSSSYIDGPMSKYLFGGKDFNFPSGDGSRYGNLQLIGVQNGTWQGEYFDAAYSDLTVTAPFNVSSTEYWKITSPSDGLTATVELRWDPNSDITPLTVTGGATNIRVAEFDGTEWIEKPSTVTNSDDYNGTIKTSAAVPINTASHPQYYTLGSISPILAKAYFTTLTDVCEGNAISVSFSGVTAGELNYILSYEIGGAPQTDVTVSSLPYSLPTVATGSGDYVLTGFTYDDPASPTVGVVDGFTVTVNALPVQPNISPADGDPSLTFCAGGSVILTSSAGTNYLWSTGATTQNISAIISGGYTVQVTNAAGCLSVASAPKTVTVNPLPVFTPSAVAGTICFGDNSQLDANFVGATTYLWSPAGELSASGIQNPVYTPATNPTTPTQVTTTFNVTVTDGNGCIDTGTIDVVLNRTPETGPQYHIENAWGN